MNQLTVNTKKLGVAEKIGIFRCSIEFVKIKTMIQYSILLSILLSKVVTLTNEWKMAVVSRETQEEHPRNGQSWNTPVPRINEECSTQVSEEIESTVNKQLSHEFSTTTLRILGALSKIDGILLNPNIRTFSGTVSGIPRNTEMENQDPTGDCSQNEPLPKVELSIYQSCNSFYSKPDEASHTVTRVEEEIPYCSRGTSSGKHKKVRSTSQPKFRSMNTRGKPETPENTGPSQLAGNSTSINFRSNTNTNLRLPKTLAKSKPTLNGK